MTRPRVTINVDPDVFNDAYRPHIDAQQPIQIFFGGSSSGKSVFLAQRCVLDLLQGGRNYLIVRNVAVTIRGSVFTEVVKAIYSLSMREYFEINRTEMEITCKITQSRAVFRGLDDPEKLKSITVLVGVITDLWIEEATETTEEAYNQLALRMRGVAGVVKRRVLSFNPITRRHWIRSRFFSGFGDRQNRLISADRIILRTTYHDNRFLDDQDRSDIEALKTVNPYYYNVYALGRWGVLGAVVFTRWHVEDLSSMRDEFERIRFGLDFGYTNDPTAMVHAAKQNGTIYILGELYERGLTNPMIADAIKPTVGQAEVKCDSAEPKSIRELQECRIAAAPVRKRKFYSALAPSRASSILHGIQWLQQHEIVVDTRCQAMANELTMYQWKKAPDGHPMNVPVDRDNHLIDALRYAFDDDMQGGMPLMVTSAERARRKHPEAAEDEALQIAFSGSRIRGRG